MTAPMRMEEDRSYMTERILNLTLEIIYLLTGESFPLLKSGDHMTIIVPPCDSLKPERHNMQKILEVNKKMMELLTGESGNLGDDNIVVKEVYKEANEQYGLMKEFSEGHIMEPPNTRNPPERCPHPLYSQDSMQEAHTIPHHYKGKDLIDAKEEMYVRDDQQSMEDGITGTFIEEDTPTDISTVDGREMRKTSEDCLTLSRDGEVEDEDITQYSPGENPATSNVHPAPHSVDGPSYSSYPEEPQTVRDGAVLPTDKRFSCTECGQLFLQQSHLSKHQRSHTGEKPHSCPECGKFFVSKSELVVHQRSHMGEKPHSCSVCGKRFPYKSHLYRHEKYHTGEKPYSCPECGKRFSEKCSLTPHLRSHTGEKPYSCSKCGRCYRKMSSLLQHQRSRIDEKLYSCPWCGKCFEQKSELDIHQRSHTVESHIPVLSAANVFQQSPVFPYIGDPTQHLRYISALNAENVFYMNFAGHQYN